MHPIVIELIAADRYAQRLEEAARWRAMRAAARTSPRPSAGWRVALALAVARRLAPEVVAVKGGDM